MKRFAAIAAACAISGAICMAEENAGAQERRLSKKERAYLRTGGIVENRAAAKGKIVFLDAGAAAGDALKDVVKLIDQEFRCNVEVSATESEFTISGAVETRKRLSANVLVAVVDNPALPMTLNAPEARWGIVNVAPLKLDAPSPETYKLRVQRAVLRGFGYVCGAANSSMACLMYPAFRAEDLDDAASQNFSPDTVMRIEDQFKAIGIVQYPRTTYKTAALAGWAPTPTNDAQRAIWDMVQAEKERGPAVQRPIRRQGQPPRPPRRAK